VTEIKPCKCGGKRKIKDENWIILHWLLTGYWLGSEESKRKLTGLREGVEPVVKDCLQVQEKGEVIE